MKKLFFSLLSLDVSFAMCCITCVVLVWSAFFYPLFALFSWQTSKFKRLRNDFVWDYLTFLIPLFDKRENRDVC